MKVTATVNCKPGILENKVQSNGVCKTINIAPNIDTGGSSIKGGELLLLSLATCYCNGIYREAGNRNLDIAAVEIMFTGDFATCSDLQYTVEVKSDAPENEINQLILHADKVAVVSNILRKGVGITLNRSEQH